MNDNEKYVYEILTACLERTIRRLWVLCVILILLLVASNGAWLLYESTMQTVETTTQTVTQDAEGDNTFIGGDYGETESYDN